MLHARKRIVELRLSGERSPHCNVQGTIANVFTAFPQPVQGHLLPGQWAYFQLILDSSDSSWMVRRKVNPSAYQL